MIVILQTAKIKTLSDVEAFLTGNEVVDFQLTDRVSAYHWLSGMLKQFRYHCRTRAEKGLLRRYAIKVTGFSRAQVTRLVKQYRESGELEDRRKAPAQPFIRRYTDEDIRLLAETDTLHSTLSGPATRKLCERMFEVFGDVRFERLASISNGHLYNLRRHKTYRTQRTTFDKTRPTRVSIGERRKPSPDGKPGYLCVDSVHQGDLDGIKGLYLITAVDEVTQFECVFAVERISERFLVPVLEQLLVTFPFDIHGFHSDNGSEYINHTVAKLLEKLRIEQTKSRPRHCNDNALVESKNGSTVRKHLGYSHIPGRYADNVNAFSNQVLTPYLNFHRPCFFPTEYADAKGKIRKKYLYDQMMTPYEKLKSLPEATSYLKPDITFEKLDAIAYQYSDNEAARQLNLARDELFSLINRSQQVTAYTR